MKKERVVRARDARPGPLSKKERKERRQHKREKEAAKIQ